MKTLPREHLAIVGPTASGKSALAFALAERLGDVEIVSLDSMQVYRGMDIGTAKPTPTERARVVHHLVDVADPDEDWSVQRTQAGTRAALEAIEARGNRALFVGGTGLYVKAIVDDLRIPAEDATRRAALELRTATDDGLADAYRELESLDPLGASRIEPRNRRRIVRALEVIELTGERFSSFGPGLDRFGEPELPVQLLGVWTPRAAHARRIEQRVAAMIDAGFVDEVRALDARPNGLSRGALQAIGYRELFAFVRGELPTIDDATARIVTRTRAFARRQRMWFRRDPRITWLATADAPEQLVGAAHALWAGAPVAA